MDLAVAHQRRDRTAGSASRGRPGASSCAGPALQRVVTQACSPSSSCATRRRPSCGLCGRNWCRRRSTWRWRGPNSSPPCRPECPTKRWWNPPFPASHTARGRRRRCSPKPLSLFLSLLPGTQGCDSHWPFVPTTPTDFSADCFLDTAVWNNAMPVTSCGVFLVYFNSICTTHFSGFFFTSPFRIPSLSCLRFTVHGYVVPRRCLSPVQIFGDNFPQNETKRLTAAKRVGKESAHRSMYL